METPNDILYEPINASDPYLTCNAQEVHWSGTEWLLITPDPAKYRDYLHGIWILSRPLENFIVKNKEIGDHNEIDVDHLCSYLNGMAHFWFDMGDACCPLKIKPYLSLTEQVLPENDINRIQDVEGLQERAIQIILSYVEQARDNRIMEPELESKEKTFHFQWIKADDDEVDSALDGSTVTKRTLEVDFRNQPRFTQALIRLLRTPQPYDGSNDYVFEKYVKVAVSLFFDPSDIYFIPWDLNDFIEPEGLPFVIIANDRQFTPEVRERMGFVARRTLDEVHRQSQKSGSTRHAPTGHNIVYGLHWDKEYLQILAHFIYYKDNASIKYSQTVVARHWITLNPERIRTTFHSEDVTMLERWRIYRALAMIDHEMQQLKEYTKISTKPLPNSPLENAPKELGPLVVGRKLGEGLTHPNPYFLKLRKQWRGDKGFEIPAEWISEGDINTKGIVPEDGPTVDVCRSMMMSLTRLVTSPIRDLFKPLQFTQLQKNSGNDDYLGPDFLHPLSIPRSKFLWPAMTSNPRETTEPHAAKLYDILTMSTADYRDINIFIANTFASHSGYNVQWCPPQLRSANTPDIFVDFAVVINPAVGLFTATNVDQGLSQAQLPIPVVLGCQLRNVTANPQNDIATILHPYLLSLESLQGLESDRKVIFVTLLTEGHLYILGALLEPKSDESHVKIHAVDCIPVSTGDGDLTSLKERVRLVMALFTLKRHVVRLAARLGIDIKEEILENDDLASYERGRMMRAASEEKRAEESRAEEDSEGDDSEGDDSEGDDSEGESSSSSQELIDMDRLVFLAGQARG